MAIPVFSKKNFKHSPWIMFGIIVFLFFQIRFTYFQCQNFPFYLWGMFSQNTHSTIQYRVYIDQDELDYRKMGTWDRERLWGQIQYFDSWKKKGDRWHASVEDGYKKYNPFITKEEAVKRMCNGVEAPIKLSNWLEKWLEQRNAKELLVLKYKFSALSNQPVAIDTLINIHGGS